jgi:hypothetical protein
LHLQGLATVNDAVCEDHSIENVDDLLEMTALTDRQILVLEGLRGRIRDYRIRQQYSSN